MSNDSSSYQLTATPRQIKHSNSKKICSKDKFKELLAEHHISQLGTNNYYAVAVVMMENFKKRTEKLHINDQLALLDELSRRIKSELATDDTVITTSTGVSYILLKQVACKNAPEIVMNKIRNVMTPYFKTSTGFLNITTSTGFAISHTTTIHPTEVLKDALNALNTTR